MKNTVLKFYITVVFLFSNLPIFAVLANESDTGDLQNIDPVHLNEKILVLLIAVVLFAFFYL